MTLIEFFEWIDTLSINDNLKQEIKDNVSTVVYNEIADTTVIKQEEEDGDW